MGQGAVSHVNAQPLDQVTVVDVDGNDMTVPESNLRTLLIQCPCCDMFKLPDLPEGYLYDQFIKGFPLMAKEVCEKCIIVSEQKEAIDFLNDQIHELTTTVEKLRAIRDIENEIEQSFICMTPSFKHQEYREVEQPSSDFSTDDLLDPTLDANANQNIVDGIQDIAQEIDNISQQFSQLNVRSVDVASVPSEQDNNLPGASDHPTDDVELEQSTAIINDEYVIIDETGSTGAPDTSLSEETMGCTPLDRQPTRPTTH